MDSRDKRLIVKGNYGMAQIAAVLRRYITVGLIAAVLAKMVS